MPCLGGDVGAEEKAEAGTEAVAVAAAQEEAGGGLVGYDRGELFVERRFSFLLGGMLR